MENFEQIGKGDMIKCQNQCVTVKTVHYQFFHEKDGWIVEFTDTSNNYRTWHQLSDGGRLIKKKGDTDNEKRRN